MGNICENLTLIRATLPDPVKLVAVSKFHPVENIQEAYTCGQRIFGESKVQELLVKQSALPKDIQWHFIGHLQSNKVKQIVPFITLIHSIDSFRLLQEVNNAAQKADRVVDCLIQIHIAQEDTKFGFSICECKEMIAQGEWKNLSHIRIRGIMGMASLTEDTGQIHSEFKLLNHLFSHLKEHYFTEDRFFNELSMGMSDDYPIAVEEGSTLIRVGSRIFGNRVY